MYISNPAPNRSAEACGAIQGCTYLTLPLIAAQKRVELSKDVCSSVQQKITAVNDNTAASEMIFDEAAQEVRREHRGRGKGGAHGKWGRAGGRGAECCMVWRGIAYLGVA